MQTISNALYASNLTMSVTLSGPSNGASLATATAIGTILNPNPQPVLSIASTSANEGSSLSFAVTRSGTTANALTVNYATANGSAISGTNYTSASGTLSFGSGVTTQNIAVPTSDDGVYTSNLAMSVSLSSPTGGAALGTASATGTIVNTDVQPSLSIAGASANEGANLSFAVSRSGALGNAITVNYGTANGSATSGTNYSATSGTLTFGSGVASQVILVPTSVDNVYSGNLAMSVSLNSPTGGAVLGTGSATGTIVNTDAQPSLSIAAATANEGSPLAFTVSRTGATGNAVTVSYSTSNGTAASGVNYNATSGSLAFAPGVTSQVVSVPTIDDYINTGNLSMSVLLSAPGGGATLGASSASGTIVNIDPAVSLSIGTASAAEGSNLNFTVTRSGGTAGAVSAHWATSNGTALAGTNYTGASGTVNIAAGATTGTITVTTLHDCVVTGSKNMYVTLSSPSAGLTISGATGSGSISNIDKINCN
ncbi:MAG: hypothetical protein KGM17_09535 [Sphingomonadales bacterium]|nr:hypothetical protein [Sphingomonadales bacterium]